MLSSHVCDDRSCSLSGKFMMRGVVVTCLLMTGAPGMVKCNVVPASAIAMSKEIFIFAVSISVCGPSSLLACSPSATVFHAFDLVGKGRLFGLISKTGWLYVTLLALTVMSPSLICVCVI